MQLLNHKRISKTLKFLIVLIILMLLLGWQPNAAAESNPDLFTAITTEASLEFPEYPIVLRSNLVQLNFQQLESSQQQVNLNLFPDTNYPAILTEGAPLSNGSRNWTGELPGIPTSDVVLVSKAGSVSGYVRLPGEFYKFRTLTGQGIAIIQLPPDDVPGMENGAESPALIPPAPEFYESQIVFEDSSSQIDVMFAYTMNARDAEGGTANMVSMIEGIILEANSGFNNSGVNTQLNLVHTLELNYNDSWINNSDDWSTMLNQLTSTSDGVIDEVHTARDQYGADLVVLLISDTTYGGLAWVMQSNSSYYEHYAFSLVSQPYALGWYIAPHEMGHNMGCAHDRDHASVNGVYSYSYGYQVDQNFRTIMSYACPNGCPRINYWSNPAVSYNALPTGIDYQAGDAADNTRSLNNTIITVANFRQSVATTPEPPTPSSPTGTISIQTPTFFWPVVNNADAYTLYVEHNSGEQINTVLQAADICNEAACSFSAVSALPAGEYTWKLKASNAVGESYWGSTASFTLLIAPEAAVLINPVEQIESQPAYSWTAGFQAAEYRLYITDSEGVIYNQWLDAVEVCDAENCTFTPPDLELEMGIHHWMIQTRNPAGAGPWTDPQEFTYAPQPGQVNLSSPSGEITAVRPAFGFSEDPASTEYRLLVSHAAFGTVINEWYNSEDICTEGACSIIPDTHLNTGNHSAWIQSRNAYHSGPYSPAAVFKLIHYTPPVDAIQPVSPINEETTGAQPVLSWQAVDMATWYKVYISDNISGKIYNAYHRASEFCSAETCSLDLADLELTLSEGKNFWFVMPVNTGGNGAWSSQQTFIVSP